jgi:hypothetical protein
MLFADDRGACPLPRPAHLFLEDRALELGKDREHLKHGPAAGRRRVDPPLLAHEEIDASCVDSDRKPTITNEMTARSQSSPPSVETGNRNGDAKQRGQHPQAARGRAATLKMILSIAAPPPQHEMRFSAGGGT